MTDGRAFDEIPYQRRHLLRASLGLPHTPDLAAGVPTVFRARLPKAIPIHPHEPADLARIRGYAIWPPAASQYKIYRGDMHRHTEFPMDCNNDGSLLDVYRYAIDAAALDYIDADATTTAGGPTRNSPGGRTEARRSVPRARHASCPLRLRAQRALSQRPPQRDLRQARQSALCPFRRKR